MKMVKSLVLGTAVAFAATVGAQAADMPVKAKPVSYVKICPQYGPGFYYIPGTDICLKVGGLLLAEAGWNARSATPFVAWGAGGFGNATNYMNWRTRAYFAMDARQNTAYGTLRVYFYGGFEYVTGQNGLNGSAVNATAAGAEQGGSEGFSQFAFLQFAGFTVGHATSFFDFAPSYMTLGTASLPWGWNNLVAYTANFGNGLSATISIEDPTNTNVGNTVAGAPLVSGYEVPDVVANIRVDQAWGSAQLAGAIKQNRFGHVDEDWGWAVSFGIEIKTPWTGAAGNSIKFQATTSEGALEYTGLGQNPYTNAGVLGLTGMPVGTPGVILVSDANTTALLGGAITQTEGTSYNLQYRHFWAPNLRSNFHVGYNDGYNRSVGSFGGFQLVQYGHSLVYSPVAGLNIALDVLYTQTDVNNVESDIVATWVRVTRPF